MTSQLPLFNAGENPEQKSQAETSKDKYVSPAQAPAQKPIEQKPFDFTDRYFFDIRFWEHPDSIADEIERLLSDERAENNSGNTVYQMRRSGLAKDELVRKASERMPRAVEELAKYWLSELNLRYFEIYGEESFKRIYEHYSQCTDWLERHGHKHQRMAYEAVYQAVMQQRLARDQNLLRQKRAEVERLERAIGEASKGGER